MWDPGLILLQSPISNMAKQRQMMNKLNATKGRNQLQRTSKQRDKPRAAIPRSVSEDPDVLRYYLALTEPFHPDAVGARVPDMYAAHTATYTVHATHTVTVNSSGAGTIFMFPNVIASIFAPQGGSSDFQTITWGDNTTTTLARWGINDDALAAKLDNYRIVGCGMRIANMSSMTNAQGKFIAGTYAIDSSWHTKDFQIAGVTMPTNSAATPGNTMADWGVPTAVNGSFASNLLIQYPGAQLKSAMELGEHCIDIVPRPVDPRAFSFRTCNAQLNGWQTAGAAAGVPSSLVVRSFWTCVGLGLPSSLCKARCPAPRRLMLRLFITSRGGRTWRVWPPPRLRAQLLHRQRRALRQSIHLDSSRRWGGRCTSRR